jgi:TonB family protein
LDVPPLADPAQRGRFVSSMVLAVALHAGLAVLLVGRGAVDSDALAGLGFNRAGVVLTAEVAELPPQREEIAAVPPEPAKPEPPAPEPPVAAQPPALPPVLPAPPAPPAPPAQESPLPPARAALPEPQALPTPATQPPGFAGMVLDMPEPEAPHRLPEIALAPPEHWPDSNDSLEDIQILIGPPQQPAAARGPVPAAPAPIRVAPVLIKPGNPLAPTSYPTAAIANRLEGDVLLGIELDRNSQVRHIRIVRSSGHATLDAAAIQSARTWKLRVHVEDYSGPGRVVSTWIEAPVSFRLN